MEGEGAPVKRLKAPKGPTAEEREEHECSGHVPYRSWCKACVIGSGRMTPHCASGEAADSPPTIAVDYAYLNDRDAEGDPVEAAPIMATKSMPDRWIGSSMVPCKGTDDFAVGRLAAEALALGAGELVIRSDQAPAILALKEAAAARIRPHGVTAKPEESAVADSRGNGLAENAVKEVKNLARTMLSSLNERYGHTFTGADAVVVWLVRYCGQMMNRFRRGPEGKTSYELRRGREFKRKLPPFGEQALCQHPGAARRPRARARCICRTQPS